MVYCKDCKYKKMMECRHPESVIRIDLVTGEYKHTKCLEMRKSDMPCGKEGKLFVKASFLEKLFQ